MQENKGINDNMMSIQQMEASSTYSLMKSRREKAIVLGTGFSSHTVQHGSFYMFGPQELPVH